MKFDHTGENKLIFELFKYNKINITALILYYNY